MSHNRFAQFLFCKFVVFICYSIGTLCKNSVAVNLSLVFVREEMLFLWKFHIYALMPCIYRLAFSKLDKQVVLQYALKYVRLLLVCMGVGVLHYYKFLKLFY